MNDHEDFEARPASPARLLLVAVALTAALGGVVVAGFLLASRTPGGKGPATAAVAGARPVLQRPTEPALPVPDPQPKAEAPAGRPDAEEIAPTTRPPDHASPPPAGKAPTRGTPARPATLTGKVSDWNLAKEFHANPVAALDKYKGNRLRVEGLVGKITITDQGEVSVLLPALAPEIKIVVICYLKDRNAAKLLAVNHWCTLEGQVDTYSEGARGQAAVVRLEGCAVLETGPDGSFGKTLQDIAEEARRAREKR